MASRDSLKRVNKDSCFVNGSEMSGSAIFSCSRRIVLSWICRGKYRVYTKEWCNFKSKQETYVSPYTGTTYTVSSGNCPSFSCTTSSSLLMLTVGPRGQFLRWRRGRKRLSVCSVLRCPDLWLQCSLFCARFRTAGSATGSYKPYTKLTRSGWGTALQTGRSRVRFPMVSLDFSLT
jgi:hypothetical protein